MAERKRQKTVEYSTDNNNDDDDDDDMWRKGTTAKTLEELVARARAIRDAGSDVLDLAGFWPLIEVAAANLPAPDYTAMSVPELLHACRDDGHKWAAAFCQHAKKQGYDIDHGWMVGWFANAIEHSHDVRAGGGSVVLPDGSAFFVAEIK